MSTYNMTKKMFYGENVKTPFYSSLMMGAWAGVVAATITYPTDLVKRRMQQFALHDAEKYSGILDCIKKIYKKEGVQACYYKVIPSASIAFAVNTKMKSFFGVYSKN